MNKQYQILCLLTILFLSISHMGCTKKDPTVNPSTNDSLELTKLAAKGITDQQPADLAKQYLSRFEEVSAVRAVNNDGRLVVGVEVHHHDRFSLEHLEKELEKNIKKSFSNMDITLSTDQKIIIELARLEEDMLAKDITKDDIGKRLTKIIELSKEET